MLIEEQIKIARLIASGTPREVAINESEMVKQSPAIDAEYEEVKDTPQQKAKKRSEIAKEKQEALEEAIEEGATVNAKISADISDLRPAQ